MTDLQKFIDLISKDNDLQVTLSDSTDIQVFAPKAVKLGAARGFTFTVEDIHNHLTQYKLDSELNEQELDEVAGAFSFSHGCE